MPSVMLSRLFFMAELAVAEFLLVYRFRPRRLFVLRLLFCVVVLAGAAVLSALLPDNVFAAIAAYILLFLLTFLAIAFCFKERFLTVLFYAVAAYTVQHISSELFGLCSLAMRFDGNYPVASSPGREDIFILFSNSSNVVGANPFTLIVYFFIYGVTYFFGYYFVKRRVAGGYEIEMKNVKVLTLAAATLLFDVLASSFVSHYAGMDFNRTYLIMISAFNVTCCVFSFAFQFFVERHDKLADELKFTEKMYKEKLAQYAMTKENINLINQKCHDMKHQIRMIGSTSAVDSGVVGEMEKLLSVFDAPVRTGNEALDVILTEKSLLCSSKNIKLCCIIDGKCLDFITPADTYALFGNMLDNAIEAVSSLDEKYRTISLSVMNKKSFVVVNTYNRCAVRPEFDGALPLTTKADKSMHGYGMRSMRMICEKYGGEMSVSVSSDLFTLNILFGVG